MLTRIFVVIAIITVIVVLNKSVLGIYLIFPPLLWFTLGAVAIVIISTIVASRFSPHTYEIVVKGWILFCVLGCTYLFLEQPVKSRWARWNYKKEKEEYTQGIGIFAPGLETEMAVAIMKNDTAAIKRLIQQGVNINARDRTRAFGYLEFAFQLSSRYSDFPYKVSAELVKIMLDNGIDPNPTYPGEMSYGPGEQSSVTRFNLIRYWREYNDDDPKIRQLLLEAGTRVPEDWYVDDSKYFELYLSHGAEINKVRWSRTPVMYLAQAERWREASRLVDLGADVSYVDPDHTSLQTILTNQIKFKSPQPTELIQLSKTVEAKMLKK